MLEAAPQDDQPANQLISVLVNNTLEQQIPSNTHCSGDNDPPTPDNNIHLHDASPPLPENNVNQMQDELPELTTWWDSDSNNEDSVTQDTWYNQYQQQDTATPSTQQNTRPLIVNTTQSQQDNTTLADNPHSLDTGNHTDNQATPLITHHTLVPTQIYNATLALAPMPIQGLTHIQGQQLPGMQDNFYVGDVMALPKNPTTTRVYFQNVNGINLTQLGNWSEICEHLRDMEVDIVLLAEHKLDTN